MTGMPTASLMRRRFSRYISGPILNSIGSAKYERASGGRPRMRLGRRYVAIASASICSSKSERITIAAAPPSSRRLTVSSVSANGLAPTMNGCGSCQPEVVDCRVHGVLPLLALVVARGRAGRRDDRGRCRAALRQPQLRDVLVGGDPPLRAQLRLPGEQS